MVDTPVFERVVQLSKDLYAMEQAKMLDDGEIMPIQFVIKDRGIIAIPSPWENDKEKHKMSRFATVLAGLIDADAIIFFAEAWVLEAKVDAIEKEEDAKDRVIDEAYNKYKSLSNHPDRKEKMLLTIFFAEGLVLVGYGDIERAGQEKRAFVEDLQWLSGGPSPTSSSASSTLYTSWRTEKFRKSIVKVINDMPPPLKVAFDDLRQSMADGRPISEEENSFAAKLAGVFIDIMD